MLTDITPPPVEPITLAEAKLFLRVEHADEDELITLLIASAREQLEAHLNAALIRRPMRVSVSASDIGCGLVRLPRWPVASVDAVRADGEPATHYHADLRKRPSVVEVAARESVEIDFTAGYGTSPADVPAPLRQAMLLLVNRAYERGETDTGDMPLMVDALTLPYRVVGL